MSAYTYILFDGKLNMLNKYDNILRRLECV